MIEPELRNAVVRGVVTWEEHIKRGRHSNIPECCIKFFWVWIHAPGEYQSWHHRFYKRYTFSAQYKQCPECILNNRINKLHSCTPKCDGMEGASDLERLKLFAQHPELWEREKRIESGELED